MNIKESCEINLDLFIYFLDQYKFLKEYQPQ